MHTSKWTMACSLGLLLGAITAAARAEEPTATFNSVMYQTNDGRQLNLDGDGRVVVSRGTHAKPLPDLLGHIDSAVVARVAKAYARVLPSFRAVRRPEDEVIRVKPPGEGLEPPKAKDDCACALPNIQVLNEPASLKTIRAIVRSPGGLQMATISRKDFEPLGAILEEIAAYPFVTRVTGRVAVVGNVVAITGENDEVLQTLMKGALRDIVAALEGQEVTLALLTTEYPDMFIKGIERTVENRPVLITGVEKNAQGVPVYVGEDPRSSRTQFTHAEVKLPELEVLDRGPLMEPCRESKGVVDALGASKPR